MKIIIMTILCLLLPCAVIAQNQAMTEHDMQNMVKLMQEMQQCMAKVDQAELDRIGQKAEIFGVEIDKLCKAGNRAEAQRKAVAFGKKMMQLPAFLQMQKCAEITEGLPMGDSMGSFADDFDFSGSHVCDD